MKLVIVESPAKAKTINKYLGNDYIVMASFGHVRDLPSKNGSVLPDKGFELKYEIPEKAEKYVSLISKEAKKAKQIFLATDPDREGESISWHIAEILKEKKIAASDDIFHRVAFNEITKKAVLHAIANPRKIDQDLVNAQQARRALDYLVGFTLSPVLWRKLPGCKSAGRVQSVALRLICEREDEIERFKTQEYWDINLLLSNNKNEKFNAKVTKAFGEKLEKFSITNESQATDLVAKLKSEQFKVDKIEKKQQKRNPPAPFITSSLQQEAARKLGFSAKKTMQIAQKLYEGIEIDGETTGLITYMRTDGVTLSMDAVTEIRNFIQKNYSDKYLPLSSRIYKSKAKNAQEAHEAIRPTNFDFAPDKIKNRLEKDFYNLYDLIWKRTIASQMESVVIDLVVAHLISPNFTARAVGSVITFDGFYKIYKEGRDDEQEEENKLLPILALGELLKTLKIDPLQHFTEPPPRYSEASLVKKLEELGIGRPSTYATILSVLQDRNYVFLDKKRFFPQELGRLLSVFLIGFFEKYVQYNFTAKLETELDDVAEGSLDWKNLLSNFWHDFHKNITQVGEQKITDIINYVEEKLDYHLFGDEENHAKTKACPSCSDGKLSLKLGKFGAFLGCSNYPSCEFKKPILAAGGGIGDNLEGLELESNDKLIGQDENGQDIHLKKGPYGPYLQVGENSKDKKLKPKRATLPPGMNSANIDLDTALKLLNLPTLIGDHPEDGEEILLGIGRFGPYLKYREKFTSIPRNLDPFAINVEQAVSIIKAGLAKAAAKNAKDGAEPKKAFKKPVRKTVTKTKVVKAKKQPK